MQSAKIFLASLFFMYLIILCFAYYKSKKFFYYLFITALQGICALFAINFIGSFIEIKIPINVISIFISSFNGISGIIMLLLIEIFLI
jgi:inhibitor of the pro-sigma K processing machinery